MELKETYYTGVGFVIINPDIERELFIRYCYESGTISVLLEDGGIVDNVKVSKEIFNYIVFPETKEEVGSTLTYIKTPETNEISIVGVITKENESILLEEYQSGVIRKTEKGSSQVVVDGDKISTLIMSSSTTESGGDIHIIGKNKNANNVIRILSTGKIISISEQTHHQAAEEIVIKVQNLYKSSSASFIRIKANEGIVIEDEWGNKIETNESGVVINQGENGGLTITPNLRDELNKLKTRMTALENILQTFASTQSAASAGAQVLAPLTPGYSVLSTSLTSLPPQGVFEKNIENDKVKH